MNPTPKTAARLKVIRAMAAAGEPDHGIADALGMTSSAVFKLRIRYDIPSTYTRPVVHGRASTYSNGGCRCTECRAANNRRQLQGRARRKARLGTARIEHGVNAYRNWGCRCQDCTKAHSAACYPKSSHWIKNNPATLAAHTGRRRWTDEDIALLMRTDLTLTEIALKLRRTYTAVTGKRSQLNTQAGGTA